MTPKVDGGSLKPFKRYLLQLKFCKYQFSLKTQTTPCQNGLVYTSKYWSTILAVPSQQVLDRDLTKSISKYRTRKKKKFVKVCILFFKQCRYCILRFDDFFDKKKNQNYNFVNWTFSLDKLLYKSC